MDGFRITHGIGLSADGFPLWSGYGLDFYGADYPGCSERSTSLDLYWEGKIFEVVEVL